MPTRRPVSLLAAVWLAGVGLATGTGVVAVQLVARQVGDPSVTVLSAADVGRELAATPATTSSATGRPRPTTATKTPTTAASKGSDDAAEHGSASAPATTSEDRPATAARPAATHQQDRGGAGTSAPATGSSATTTSDVRSFDSQGGSVGVRCRGTAPEQVFASPAQGYRLDDSSVSGSTLEVKFESSTTDVRLKVSCSTGSPVLAERRVEPRAESGGDTGGSTTGGGSFGSHSDGSVDGTGEKP